MVNFIKCPAEVHDYDISLSSLVQGVIQVLSELDKLGLTTDPTPKPMLVVKKKVVILGGSWLLLQRNPIFL